MKYKLLFSLTASFQQLPKSLHSRLINSKTFRTHVYVVTSHKRKATTHRNEETGKRGSWRYWFGTWIIKHSMGRKTWKYRSRPLNISEGVRWRDVQNFSDGYFVNFFLNKSRGTEKFELDRFFSKRIVQRQEGEMRNGNSIRAEYNLEKQSKNRFWGDM